LSSELVECGRLSVHSRINLRSQLQIAACSGRPQKCYSGHSALRYNRYLITFLTNYVIL